MRTYFACWHVDELCRLRSYLSMSLIAFFHMMILLLLDRFLIVFVWTEMYLLLVVVNMGKFEQRFKLAVNLLSRLRRLLFRLIGEIDMGECLGRFFYVGEFIYQHLQCQTILLIISDQQTLILHITGLV